MILSKFEVKFYQQLEEFFQRHDFNLYLEHKQFRKATQNGFQNIIFSISETQKEFWVEVNFGIRYEFIEQLAQQFLNSARGNRSSGNTLVISFGKFQNLKYFRFRITDENEMHRISEEIKDFFMQRGFRFLEEVACLQKIDDLINDMPTKPCRYLYNQIHRCFKGVIAAKLTDNHSFTTITNIYRHFLLKNASDEELLNYERLVSFLHFYSPN
jgi:hypothetical protein